MEGCGIVSLVGLVCIVMFMWMVEDVVFSDVCLAYEITNLQIHAGLMRDFIVNHCFSYGYQVLQKAKQRSLQHL